MVAKLAFSAAAAFILSAAPALAQTCTTIGNTTTCTSSSSQTQTNTQTNSQSSTNAVKRLCQSRTVNGVTTSSCTCTITVNGSSTTAPC